MAGSSTPTPSPLTCRLCGFWLYSLQGTFFALRNSASLGDARADGVGLEELDFKMRAARLSPCRRARKAHARLHMPCYTRWRHASRYQPLAILYRAGISIARGAMRRARVARQTSRRRKCSAACRRRRQEPFKLPRHDACRREGSEMGETFDKRAGREMLSSRQARHGPLAAAHCSRAFRLMIDMRRER